MTQTLYDTLEVSPGASPETIQAAYHSLLKRYHPDKAGANGTKVSQAINAAYDVLKDPQKRARYDAQLRRDAKSPPPPPPPREEAKPKQPDPPPQASAIAQKRPSAALTIILGACFAQLLAAAAETFVVQPPGTWVLAFIDLFFSFKGVVVAFFAAVLVIGFLTALLAARIGLQLRPGKQGEATTVFRFAVFTAMAVTLPLQSIFAPHLGPVSHSWWINLVYLGSPHRLLKTAR